jgi:hypothetical protein
MLYLIFYNSNKNTFKIMKYLLNDAKQIYEEIQNILNENVKDY